MATAHYVKKARKDYPDIGVQKGEPCWWWEFRFGGTYRSKTQPRPSQLTQSEFMSTYLGIGETLEDALAAATCKDDVESAVEEAKSSIEELRDEQQEKKDNMPEQLQEADSGQLLQERYDQLDEWCNDLDSVDYSELEEAEDSAQNDISGTVEEKIAEALQNLKDEINSLDPGIS